jgi:hypothetical protein
MQTQNGLIHSQILQVLSWLRSGKLAIFEILFAMATLELNMLSPPNCNRFPFLIGIVVSAVMLSVVDSSVNTVIVCFAEGPVEFEQNHPDLSQEMREGWRKVYPEECGF